MLKMCITNKILSFAFCSFSSEGFYSTFGLLTHLLPPAGASQPSVKTPAAVYNLGISPILFSALCFTIFSRLRLPFFYHTSSFHSTFHEYVWIQPSVTCQLLLQ
ncbi:hypothetical protein ATANTOWER_026508 [Ataeniobius toweri]|uniref:Uncharacterized protein n=1 Tax=Ataeniobius toweri TaxID=208326 RepID=A0ABU7BUX3_9TELE|nr:hypothetical protein [Ataeniobius toweri]